MNAGMKIGSLTGKNTKNSVILLIIGIVKNNKRKEKRETAFLAALYDREDLRRFPFLYLYSTIT